MKSNLKYLCLFLFAILLLGACKNEGELIEAKGYGVININATTTTDIGNLLVDIDGKVVDTLKPPSAVKAIKAYTGDRKLKIYQTGKEGAPVIDTLLNVEGKDTKLSFLYTAEVKIIGGGYDGSVTPAKGNSLVQFVNLEKSLPASVDLKIYELYYTDNGDILSEEVTTVKNIRKDRFSPYIELGPTKHGDYTFGYYFGVFEPGTGNMLVDVLTYYPTIYWDSQGSQYFKPNKVISLGFVYDPVNVFYATPVIYDTELK
ncbi:hypothetical protein GCM10023149_20980 [Mucilaginibacter gynuensis]|uniref:DUF4397 domain-containing protein n=1 Tax=Mucilaginibacter gynuensis TaxID=1302236 RepID=A0ABP8GBE5_9SPHI